MFLLLLIRIKMWLGECTVIKTAIPKSSARKFAGIFSTLKLFWGSVESSQAFRSIQYGVVNETEAFLDGQKKRKISWIILLTKTLCVLVRRYNEVSQGRKAPLSWPKKKNNGVSYCNYAPTLTKNRKEEILTEKEHELKMMLTKDEHHFLLRFFDKHMVESGLQTNYYYDTRDEMIRKRNVTVSVRLKNDKLISTVKGIRRKMLVASKINFVWI